LAAGLVQTHLRPLGVVGTGVYVEYILLHAPDELCVGLRRYRPGGIDHRSFRWGVSSFASRPGAPSRTRRSRPLPGPPTYLPAHPKRPSLASGGRSATRKGDQAGLLLPIQLTPVLPIGSLCSIERRLQPLTGVSLSHACHGRESHLKGSGDGRIGPARSTFPLVGLQQDARVGKHRGRSTPTSDEGAQVRPLLLGKAHHVLFFLLTLVALLASSTAHSSTTGKDRSKRNHVQLMPDELLVRCGLLLGAETTGLHDG
jgi:hypothetical protein